MRLAAYEGVAWPGLPTLGKWGVQLVLFDFL